LFGLTPELRRSLKKSFRTPSLEIDRRQPFSTLDLLAEMQRKFRVQYTAMSKSPMPENIGR